MRLLHPLHLTNRFHKCQKIMNVLNNTFFCINMTAFTNLLQKVTHKWFSRTRPVKNKRSSHSKSVRTSLHIYVFITLINLRDQRELWYRRTFVVHNIPTEFPNSGLSESLSWKYLVDKQTDRQTHRHRLSCRREINLQKARNNCISVRQKARQQSGL